MQSHASAFRPAVLNRKTTEYLHTCRQSCNVSFQRSIRTTKRYQNTKAPSPADFSSIGGTEGPKSPWKPARPISITEHPNPQWKYGQGATDGGRSINKKHIEIDPFAEDRPMFHNYSLLISGVVPRPISFISTLSAHGEPNLAPFSYFQVVDHDPPVFIVGFSGRNGASKDTLRNLEQTGECVINTVSEHMIEAVNATSIDAPHGVSEWEISGLTQAASSTVKPARVKESIFSIEGKLNQVVDLQAHGRLAIIKGTNFWVREDGIDEKRSHIDLEVLRPLGQLGGISYARVSDTFEIARRTWKKDVAKVEADLAEEEAEEQQDGLNGRSVMSAQA